MIPTHWGWVKKLQPFKKRMGRKDRPLISIFIKNKKQRATSIVKQN